MDEVMADTMGAMFEWYNNNYSEPIDYSKMKGSWLLGIPDQYRSIVRDRLFSQGFFRHLPVMEDCVDVVNELNKKYEVFIVSAAMEFPDSLIIRPVEYRYKAVSRGNRTPGNERVEVA